MCRFTRSFETATEQPLLALDFECGEFGGMFFWD